MIIIEPQTDTNLGRSNIVPASEYFNELSKAWSLETVAPVFTKSGLLANASDFVPAEIKIIPETLTLQTSYAQGDLSDDNRKRKISNIPPVHVINPAQNSVFVYVFNGTGKLIPPVLTRTDGSHVRTFHCPYDIKIFGNHLNGAISTSPYVAADEVDGTGTYNPEKPNRNPPHAIMVRARSAGLYSIHVVARLTNSLINLNAEDPKNDIHLLKTLRSGNFQINAIESEVKIDRIAVEGVGNDKLTYIEGQANLSLTEGETVELFISGLVTTSEWSETLQTYTSKPDRVVTLQQLNWSYQNSSTYPTTQPKLSFSALNANATRLTLKAGKSVPKIPTVGFIEISGHGKRFSIKLNIASAT